MIACLRLPRLLAGSSPSCAPLLLVPVLAVTRLALLAPVGCAPIMPLAARRHARLHGSSAQAGRGEGDHPWRIGPSPVATPRPAATRSSASLCAAGQPDRAAPFIIMPVTHAARVIRLDQASLDPGRLSYGKHCSSARPWGRLRLASLQLQVCASTYTQHLPRICALSKATTSNAVTGDR